MIKQNKNFTHTISWNYQIKDMIKKKKCKWRVCILKTKRQIWLPKILTVHNKDKRIGNKK